MIRLLRMLIAPHAIGLIALLAVPAHAQLNLSWDDCGAAGDWLRVFACNTNESPLSGINANLLVGSFVSPGLSAVFGEDAYVDIYADRMQLPSWWWITNYVGTVVGCRPHSVLVTKFGNATGASSCVDSLGARGFAGGTDFILGSGPPQATIRLLGQVPEGSAGPIPAGEENYAFCLRILNDRTVGTDACGGCLQGVALQFDLLILLQAGGAGDVVVQGPPAGGRNYVLWNSGLVPASPSTWGRLKALYR